MKKRYLIDLLAFIPIIVPASLQLIMRPMLYPCTKANNCEGMLLVFLSFLGAVIAFLLYALNKRALNKVFSIKQEKRLLIGTFLWIAILIGVAGEMLIRNS